MRMPSGVRNVPARPGVAGANGVSRLTLNHLMLAGTVAAGLILGACRQQAADSPAAPDADPRTAANAAASGAIAQLRFADAPPPAGAAPPPPQVAIEVTLDRLGFSPGAIDGVETARDGLALRAFQQARGLPVTGRADPATRAAIDRLAIPPLRTVRIPAAFAAGPFAPDLPKDTAKQAAYPRLAYRDLGEALAERFHTTPQFIATLNGPAVPLGPDAVVQVPNVPEVDVASLPQDARGWNATLVTLGVAPQQPQAERISVSKGAGVLRAFDAAGGLIAQFPVTTGSARDPLPLGTWKVLGVSRNPDYHFNPKLFWDARDDQPNRLLKPGPNSPVGVVWIDLSKPHYGLHGTPEPALIGQTESHGCVRLTNWDAARLAQMVKPGIAVRFER